MKIKVVQEKMTFEEFKSRLFTKFGKVHFREEGKYGWTSVEDILDKHPGGRSGPHWCDASPIPATQWLLGSYNFNTETAEFYER